MKPQYKEQVQVTVWGQPTIALLDTGANISVIPQTFSEPLPQKPNFLKLNMHKVMSASGANLGPIVTVISHLS